MEGPDQTNPCAICLGGMGTGGGQAIFTAECSHTFHFNCISASVAHGHLVCPLCHAQWRELPFVRPTPVPLTQPLPQPSPVHVVQPRQPPAQPPAHPVDPVVFDDDEQVEAVPADGRPSPSAAASTGTVVVKTHTEYSAIARDSCHDKFAVLVHVKAPGIVDGDAAGDAPRAPLDLVTVLDVSGSMSGYKLALMKQAMRFVIDNLGPHDRLSVVSFSSGARRVTRLARMSDAGKALSVSAVESLAASGGTNIAEGLRTAAKVLDERRHRNAVSSVILLSDGQDNYTMRRQAHGREANYEALVPPSFARAGAGDWSAPIHTFGFGSDHDASAMHVIAEATGGTFSFIENEAVIQDAFAQCIGGLLSVVVQEARIAVACVHPGVRVSSVKSGRYESRVDEDGRAASVRVGELYADEERRFLLFLVVPRADATDGDTTLMKVTCSYRDAAAGVDVSVTADETVVVRPEHAVDAERSVDVERERVRVEATEDIAAARAAAERGAHQEAVEILETRQRAVARSEVARDGDPVIVALGTELRDMRGRVMNRQRYARSGRAYMLAGMSAHAQQRSNSRQMQMQQPVQQQQLMMMQQPVQQQQPMMQQPQMMMQRQHMMMLTQQQQQQQQMTMTHLAGGVGGGAAMPSNPAAFTSGPAAPVEMSNEATLTYATPAMRAMLLRSRRAREASDEHAQQQQQPEAEAGEDAEGTEPKVRKT